MERKVKVELACEIKPFPKIKRVDVELPSAVGVQAKTEAELVIVGATEPTTVKAEQETEPEQEAEDVATFPSNSGVAPEVVQKASCPCVADVEVETGYTIELAVSPAVIQEPPTSRKQPP